jgi:tetratricopeptide (TPR) repeat protein
VKLQLLVIAMALTSTIPSLQAQVPQSEPSSQPASGPASPLPPLRKAEHRQTLSKLLGPRNTLNPEELQLVDDVFDYLAVDWTTETDETIRRFLLAHPNHPKALLLHAVVVRARLDPAGAKPLFENVVKNVRDSLEGQAAALMLDIDNHGHPTTSYQKLITLAKPHPDYHQLQWLAGIAASLTNDRSRTNALLYPLEFGDASPRILDMAEEAVDDSTTRFLEQSLRFRQDAVNRAPAGWTYCGLSHGLTRLNREVEAEKAAAKAVDLDPKNARLWVNWAETLIRLKRFPDAAAKCEKALVLDPKSAEAAVIYGFALENSNRLADAFVQYNKAAGIKNFPETLRSANEILALPPAGARTEIIKYLSQGKQSDAETIADQLAAKYPADEAVQFMQGVLVRSRFDVTAARPYFQFVAKSPDSVRSQCATLMLNIDTRVDSQKSFDKLCDLARQHPTDVFVLWTAAIASRTLDCNLEGAEFYGMLCKQFASGPSLVHQTYGNILMALNLQELALAQRKVTVKMEPATWSVDALGLTLGKLRFYEAANAAHSTVSKASPGSSQYWLNWAVDLRKWGHYEDAIAKCQKVIEINPNNASAYNEWGQNLEALGKKDEAIAKYERAIQLDPTRRDNYMLAVYLLESKGDHTRATELRNQAPAR